MLANHYSDVWDVRRDIFFESATGDIICIDDYFTPEICFMDFVTCVADTVRQVEGIASVEMRGWDNSEYILHLTAEKRIGLIRVLRDVASDPLIASRATVFITVYGEREIALAAAAALRKQFGMEKLARVTWLWMEDNRVNRKTVVLDAPKPIHSEFYPWIKGGIDQYFAGFLAADAAIMFMLGAAGTGKTSLIRHFIHHNRIGAMVTYEDLLLATDAMFVEFLTSQHTNLLVIEDADLMLGSREHEGNKLVARFLNISDGLVNFKRKKIIFTTNLNDFNNIDQALVRPGRCFDAPIFRPLTHTESIAAAKVARLPIPLTQESRTLAQLFNQSSSSSLITMRKVGF